MIELGHGRNRSLSWQLRGAPPSRRCSAVHSGRRFSRVFLALTALVLAGLSLAPAAAPGATTATVDFETGPPIGQAINDDYSSVGFVSWDRADFGFRPYRRVAGVSTASGTVAADIGPDHCYPGEEDNPVDCEFVTPGSLGRLASAASAITVYTGLFSNSNDSVTATLTAYNAAGTPVGSQTVPIGVGITTPISITRPAADISRFGLVAGGPGGVGAELGLDELTLRFPGSPLPDDCFGGFDDPGTGVRVNSPIELENLLRSDFTGRVIVPRGVSWEMKDADGNPMRGIPLRSGVELIGERGPLGSRPLLYTNYEKKMDNYTLFEVTGNDVRVEGLHLRGPKPASDHTNFTSYIHGITVTEDADQQLGRRVVIAGNEFEKWNGGGVNLAGVHRPKLIKEWDPSWAHLDREDANLVRVVGNYMHHNVVDGGGYGVVVDGGAYGYIAGNVFDFNRHAVAAAGKAYSGYIARFNYVLQGGIKQGSYYNQHFDVHGTANDGYGGYAGEYFRIADNTIRGEQSYYLVKTRPAFMLRGKPAQGAWFDDNIAVHDDLDSAVALVSKRGSTGIGEDHKKFNFHASGNRFDTDYTREVASGDFDGDGCTDVFLATGTTWFYSRAGKGAWELLDTSRRRTRDLGFADVDNDGITDVIHRRSSGKLVYLKRGTFDTVSLPSSPVSIEDLRFGDFDGDGRTDIFYTRGGQWFVWYASTRVWTKEQTSSTPISEMLFGEFDDVAGTDVAAVRNGAWSYSSGASEPWLRLNAKLVGSFKNAVAADFNGNGRTDIAFSDGERWRYSRDGRFPLALLRKGSSNLKRLLIGRFAPGAARPRPYTPAQVISFNPAGLRFIIWRGLGKGDAFKEHSAQNMR